MAGYTGEKRWNGVSDLTQKASVEMVATLLVAEAAFDELQELYSFSGSTIQGLADLLFTDEISARTTPGTNTAWTIDVVNTTAQIDFGTDGAGIVDSVAIVDGGFGYVNGGTFNITVASDAGHTGSPEGTNAIITYTVLSGAINSVTITDAGSGYTTSLAATTDVASADLPATPSTGIISAANISTGGTGYHDGNYSIRLSQTGTTGSPGTLSYVVDGGIVTSLTIKDPGKGYALGTGLAVVDSPLAGGVSDTVANADEVAKAQSVFDAITALHEIYQCANNVSVAQEDRLAQLRRMT